MNTYDKYKGLMSLNEAHQNLRKKVYTAVFVLMSMALCSLSIGVCFYLYTSKSMVPYVVSIDRHGVVVPYDRLQRDVNIPREAIVAELCSFIRNMRSVSSDSDVQSQSVLKSYAYVRDKNVISYLNTFYMDSNPLVLGRTTRRSVAILNVLAGSNSTMQIDWEETDTSQSDGVKSGRTMRAMIVYEVDPGGDIRDDRLMLNPLGIYIKEYSASEIVNVRVKA